MAYLKMLGQNNKTDKDMNINIEGGSRGKDKNVENFLREQNKRIEAKIAPIVDFLRKELSETKKKKNKQPRKKNRHTKLFFREEELEKILKELGNITEG